MGLLKLSLALSTDTLFQIWLLSYTLYSKFQKQSVIDNQLWLVTVIISLDQEVSDNECDSEPKDADYEKIRLDIWNTETCDIRKFNKLVESKYISLVAPTSNKRRISQTQKREDTDF